MPCDARERRQDTHLGAQHNRIGLEIGDGWLRPIDFFDEYCEFAGSVALVVINAYCAFGGPRISYAFPVKTTRTE